MKLRGSVDSNSLEVSRRHGSEKRLSLNFVGIFPCKFFSGGSLARIIFLFYVTFLRLLHFYPSMAIGETLTSLK